MGKRKRKERREKQKANAVKRGDLSAIRNIAQRSPEAGANALVAALESGTADPVDPDVQAFALSLVEPIRDKDRQDLVLRLVGCFPAPPTALRLARALSALATYDDATVEADMQADPSVARLVRPLADAAKGGKPPRTPNKSLPAMRAVYAIARAVSLSGLGSRSQAKKALDGIDAVWSRHLRVDVFRKALELRGSKPPRVQSLVDSLMRHEIVAESPRACRAIGMELASRFPQLTLSKSFQSLRLSAEDERDVFVRASLSDGALDSEWARVSALIASVGASAFPPEHRPVAKLFEGFALSKARPSQAKSAFDAAIAGGADLAEAHRGRVLVELYGGEHREAGKTFLRIAKLLERDAGGDALAIEAAILSATSFLEVRDHPSIREGVALAQRVDDRSHHLPLTRRANLLVLEARTYFTSDRPRARELLEQAEAIDPKCVKLWQGKVEFAEARGDSDAAEALILQAAALGIDEDFASLARAVRAKRGETWTPEPGKATAGELAAELCHRIVTKGTPSESIADLLRCRDALPPMHQVAFDLAHWATLCFEDHHEAADALLRATLPTLDPPTRDTWLLFACMIAATEQVTQLIVARAKQDFDESHFVLCCKSMAFQEPYAAMNLIGQISPLVPQSTLRRIQGILGGARDEAVAKELLRRLEPFASVLKPAFSLRDLFEGKSPVEEESPAFLDDEDMLNMMVGEVLSMMGAPPEVLLFATPEQMEAARSVVVQFANEPNVKKRNKLAGRLFLIFEGGSRSAFL